MKQVLQDLREGRTYLEDVPAPLCPPGHVLIRTTRSLISPGTERMLLQFGKASLLQKARLQPDRVRDVLNKIKVDGLVPTAEAVFAKLGDPIPLGYCNVGSVVECGDDELRQVFPVGTRVVSNGHHAEYVLVGKNLIAQIPKGVGDEDAAFVVPAAIALQGIRLSAPTLGETVFVMGVGMIGLLAVQLLRANGCRVIASDFDVERLNLAESFGAEIVNLSAGTNPAEAAMRTTRGRGADVVLITAATDSNEPIRQAAQMCRARGRIVLIGVAGLDIDRTEFFRKELSFQVSCSYGPGRYDADYEEGGHDYPIGYVRWTEQRNFEAVLQLMESGALTTSALVTHRHRIDDVEHAYAKLDDSKALGIVLEYDESESKKPLRRVVTNSAVRKSQSVQVGFVGAGNFSRRVLIPLLQKRKVSLHTIASRKGVTAQVAAKKFGFARSASDESAVMTEKNINCVFITSPHALHSKMAVEAIAGGKNVFVEKPLAISAAQLRDIQRALAARREVSGHSPAIMVGFNRRFSPHVKRVATMLRSRTGPAFFQYTVNAGKAAEKGWLSDRSTSGGRVIGEVCHFIDTLHFLADCEIGSVCAMRANVGQDDSCALTLRFADGSIGVITYIANGPKSIPKESLLVTSDGMAAEINNFRATTIHALGKVSTHRTLKQDKGHAAEIDAFLKFMKDGSPCPIAFDQLLEVTLATFAAEKSMESGTAQNMSDWFASFNEEELPATGMHDL